MVCVIVSCGRSKEFAFYFFNTIKYSLCYELLKDFKQGLAD